jgi:wyosine [tRNA(Phe)-imidazoG37] synthetase (radical SAM superfamily)
MERVGTYTYGPVPSRRLGRSLGVDLVPFKTCTYDCVYCQLGRTTHRTIDRACFVPVAEVVAEVGERLASGVRPDYIALAGSGEPTLHSAIAEVIGRIKALTDVPVAVLTNGSLLWMPDVREALMGADLVLPSLDAGDERSFQLVNRPHPAISFEAIADGLTEFTAAFGGEVWLEVLLLEGLTDSPAEVSKIVGHVERIRPARVQLNTACRPPAESGVRPVPDGVLESLGQMFSGQVDIVAERTAPESVDEHRAGAPDEEILALLERRPCTGADVAHGLGMHVAEVLKHLEALRARGAVRTVNRRGRTFYVPGHDAPANLDHRETKGV